MRVVLHRHKAFDEEIRARSGQPWRTIFQHENKLRLWKLGDYIVDVKVIS